MTVKWTAEIEQRLTELRLCIIETRTFQKQSEKIWYEDERLDFISWIAVNPLAGDVIPNAEGARKVRWSIRGRGKRGSNHLF